MFYIQIVCGRAVANCLRPPCKGLALALQEPALSRAKNPSRLTAGGALATITVPASAWRFWCATPKYAGPPGTSPGRWPFWCGSSSIASIFASSGALAPVT